MIVVAASPVSWFRSAAGRRYYRHFAALLAAKLALLLILYFVFIAPQPRPDTSPAAVFSALVEGRGPAAQTDTP